MGKNSTLRKAREDKHDEYYTQLHDIENELKHYKKHFKDKIIFCNCDDPYESNFFKYFAMNFNTLELKKLVCTCYSGSPFAETQLSFDDVFNKPKALRNPYKIVINEVKDYNGDGAVDLADVDWLLKNDKNSLTLLDGDGDFSSEECLKLLEEADIVVTNPPFSIARSEYVPTLLKYNKKFVIVGNNNWATDKTIFPYIRDNLVWIGYKSMGSDMLFNVNKEFAQWLVENKKEGSGYRIVDGEIKGRAQAIWYTNLDIDKRHDELLPYLYKKYTPAEYPKYENYDAIDVTKVSDIPIDYDGIMGVPVTFLDKYNPNEFEIIGTGSGKLGQSIGVGEIKPEHKKMMTSHAAKGDLYIVADGKIKIPFARVLIRKR